MLFSLWKGIDKSRGHIDQPRWSDIEQAINVACASNSSVKLYLQDGVFGQDIMSLSAESGNYLLDLYLNISDDDDTVIPLNNPNWEAEDMHGLFYKEHPKLGKVPMIEISGNYWDARSVTTDIEVVKTIFKEFFETGKITHLWMRKKKD